MSVSISDRSTLLAEARAEWLREAQTKSLETGVKTTSSVPSDSQLISQDAQLAAAIKKAEAAAEAAAKLAGSSLSVVG